MASFIPRFLRQLRDVTITSVQDGDVLAYDDGSGEWVNSAAAGGGAPTDADYLVGTSTGSLSAEIVVGTSPGGELGGTWASPTVDTTHSGSSHAGIQAAAEATAAAALSTHESDTTSVHGITDTSTLYRSGGTDVALADGGTGASLSDPNVDRIVFWDDTAGAVTWLQPGSGLSISGTVIDLAATPYTVGGTDVALADGGTGASLSDPNADRIMFWDDSGSAVTWLQTGAGLSISGTVVDFAADMATQAELDAHTGDTSAAHAASAISFTPAGSIAATDVQAAIEEVASEAGGGTPGGSDGQVQYNNGGSFGGADFGKVVTDITAWGEPGLVDPIAGDDSAGWIGIKASATFSDITAGFGSNGDTWVNIGASSGSAGITAGEPDGGALTLTLGSGAARLELQASTDQAATPLFDLKDEGGASIVQVLNPAAVGFFNATPVGQPAAPTTINELIAVFSAAASGNGLTA